MPPGSAESLPPSNAKPYTPSLSNGVSKPARDCATLLTSSLGPAPVMSDPEQPQPYAHKHFKKRYLAAADPSSVSPGSGSGGTTPPSPSVGAGVSPEAADACEALLELGRSQEAGPRTTSRSSNESSSGSDTARSRGSPSDSQPLQSLREAVWTKVATNFRKQVDEKLQEPPKDSPMNLSANAPAPVSQCTIRGQQIIEHIIENILDKPMEGQACAPCEPINVSVNNNQEEGIKASIYESLKNDLLKGKTPLMTSSKSAPCTPPGGAQAPGSVSAPSGSQSKNSLPTTKPSPLPQLVPITQSAKLPPGAVHKMTSVASTVSSHSAPNSATPSPSASSSTPASLSPASITPPGHQDVLRLLARSSQLPLSCPLPVGNSAITITKTPRLSQPHHIPSTVASVSPTPVSVSLTRTGSNQVFNLGPALSNGGPSSGCVTSIAGVPMVFTSQPGMVLTTGGHGPGPGSVVLTGLAGHGGQPGECVLLSPAGPGSGQAGAGVILQQAMGGALHQGQVVIAPAGGQPLLIPAGSKLILAPPGVPSSSPRPGISHSSPVTQASHDQNSSDPVNLTVAKLRPHPEAGNNREAASSNLLSVSPGLATLKRPASLSDGEEEDIRRSARQTKGKRYQEFIEDGRINVNSRPKRRSHRSGDEEAMDTVEPLHQADTKLTTETQPSTQTSTGMNHWKKKMRTVSLGETQSLASTGGTGHERLRTHQLGNREPEPESARYHGQSSRSTRQHSHHNPHPGPQPGRGAFDVKLGNKKLRGEKISH